MALAVKLLAQLERLAQRIVDFCYTLIPRRRPSTRALEACRLVSHRGEHDNRRVRENTMAAFEATVQAGIWGVEFDLCWTRDLQPVVIHDATTGRVFGIDLVVADVDFDDLRRQIPEIPALQEVVEAFGGRVHLMVELKRDRLGQDADKASRLAEIFSGLTAIRDYHFLALQCDLFQPVEFAGSKACLLVAELRAGAFSRLAIENDYGGLCGHYLLMNERLHRLHRSKGQKLGTGFPNSRFCFYRELNRGVEWIFTDRASKLVNIRTRLLRRSQSPSRL